MALPPQQQPQQQVESFDDLVPDSGPQNFDELIALQQQELAAPDDIDRQINEQVAYLNNLLYGAQQRREEAPIKTPEPVPDRGLFMEALAGIGSGALGSLGAGLSGIERIAERLEIDPTGDDAGWFRQAGEAMKKGAEEIKASPDKEIYFKTFNAFGSILGFAAPALAALPISGIASIGIGATLAAGTGADEAYDRAIEGKATEEQIDQSVGLGTALGLTEILAPIKIIKSLGKVMPDWDFMRKFINKDGLNTTSTEELINKTTKEAQSGRLNKILSVNDTGIKEFAKRVGSTVGLEGSQEFLAAVGQNAIERYIYKPDTDLLNADAIEEGLYGGGAGGMLQGIISTFSMRKSRQYRKKMEKFLESDEYGQIRTEAEQASDQIEEADARIKELQEKDEVFFPSAKSTKKQIENAVRDREKAGIRLQRANALAEKALNDKVYTSNEVLDYLSNQVDEDGNSLYSPEYLKSLQKSDREKGTSYLKTVYSGHVQDTRTKHELDIEEKYLDTINPLKSTPEQIVVNTVDDVEDLKQGRTAKEFEVEVEARIEDGIKFPNDFEIQQSRLGLRGAGLDAGTVNKLFDNFSIEDSNDNYLKGIQNILTKGIEADTKVLKDILKSDETPTIKKRKITNLVKKQNRLEKEEAKIKKEDDKKNQTQEEKAEEITNNEQENKKEFEQWETIQQDNNIETTETKVDDVSKDLNVPTGTAGQIVTDEKEPTSTLLEQEYSREPVDAVSTSVVGEVDKGVSLIDVRDPTFTDQEPEVEVADPKDIEGNIEQGLFDFIDESILDVSLATESSDAMSDADIDELNSLGFSANDILIDIKNEGAGYKKSLNEIINKIPKGRLKQKAMAMGRAIDSKFKDNKINDQVLNNIKSLNDTKNKNKFVSSFSIIPDSTIKKQEDVVDTSISEMGPAKYKELANAVATMLGVSGSVKNIDEVISTGRKGGQEYTYKFKNNNNEDVSVVFKNIEDSIGQDLNALGKYDVDAKSVIIDPSHIASWTHALGTTAHESFHAAKRLLFTQDQQSVFEKALTVDLAIQNGFKVSKYENILNTFYNTDSNVNQDLTSEEISKRKIEYIKEEAQAFLYEKWYTGENVIGLIPPARNLMSILKQFFNQFNNYVRREVFNQEINLKEDTNEVVLKQMKDFASGELARRTGAMSPPNAANFAAQYLPENSESILNATWASIVKGGDTPVSVDKDGNAIMKDISVVARILSHASAVSERSAAYKKFYNKIQDRVSLRNSIKQVAEIFLEKVGPYEGIFNLKNNEVRQIQSMSLFADEGATAPVFENLNTDKATASVRISQAQLDEITSRYITLDRFIKDINLNWNQDIKQYVAQNKRGEDTTYYEMKFTDPKLANAFAGSTKAIEHVGKWRYAGMIHNFLNGPALKNTPIKIRTKGTDGEGKDVYETAIKDFNAIKTDLKSKGILNAQGVLDKERYEAYQKEEQENNLSPEDRIMGGLPFEGTSNQLGAQDVFTILQNVTADSRRGYFPHYRYGSRVVGVYSLSGELVRMESAESDIAERLTEAPVIGDIANKRIIQKQNELVADLRAEYGANFEVKPIELTLDSARLTNPNSKSTIMDVIDSVDIITNVAASKSSDEKKIADLKKFANIIKQRAMTTRIEALSKDRRNVPGYVSPRNNDGKYYKQSIQRYVDEGSNTASSLYEEPEILEAKQNIADTVVGGIRSNLYRLAEGTFVYINKPNSEATFLRSFAFHSFLGFNFSSAVVNLTQTVQATYPILSSITGVGKGTQDILSASRDAIKLSKHMMSKEGDKPRLGKYGFEFFTTELVDGEPRVILDESRKPSGMPDDEFVMLAKLFQKGTIQPIQNMDLGAGTLSESINKLGIDKPVIRTIADSSGFAFGYVENLNRITAALAFYRAAKRDAQNNNKSKFNAFASSTRFSEPLVDDSGNSIETDTEEGRNAFAERMAEMGIEKTQFFMGKENRPTFFRGPFMSAATQFQSFLFQMVGTYATAFRTSFGAKLDQYSPEDAALLKGMARKQLGMMSLTMVAFGGGMGLPFMENFKEMWKFITENFGEEVGEDVEMGMREVLVPMFGETTTDMFLRGIPKALLNIDISRRTGYGDVIPLRLLMGGDPVDFAGPGIARLADQAQGVNNAFERSRGFFDTTTNVAAALAPIAFGNAIEAFISEPSRGTLTRRGQQLLPAESLSGAERVIKALGFTPTKISRARERAGIENYYQYRSKNGKDRYTNRMALSLSNYMKKVTDGDYDGAMEDYQDYLQDFLHVTNHDLSNMSNPSRQYNINIDTVQKRASKYLNSMGMETSTRVRKSIRPQIQRLIQEGVIPSDE